MAQSPTATVAKPQPTAGEPRKQASVAEILDQITKLVGVNNLKPAENLALHLAKARPRLPDAHSALGVIFQKMGRQDEAIAAMRQAVKLNPAEATYHSNLGELLRQSNLLDEAAQELSRAIVLNPKLAKAQNNLGIVRYDQARFEDAADCYRKALAIDTKYAEARNNLGNALRAQNLPEDAIREYELAIELRGDYVEAYNNMGTVLRDQHKFEEAEASYQRAISLKPAYTEAKNNLASLYVSQDRDVDALKILGDILKDDPKHVPTLITVARVQLSRGAADLADAACQHALRVEPENPEALCVLGQVCHDTDRYDEAIVLFEKALAIKPDYPECLNFFGIVLKSVGRLEEAKTKLMRALELQPASLGTYTNLADLEKFDAEHPLFKAMTEVYDKAEDKDAKRFTALHFALGKAYDDMADSDKAFFHFSTGARLKRSELTYDEKETFAFFDSIKETFSKDFITNAPFKGLPTELPVFIIGMPRSGSTLTEQVLASHPDVFGAGEIKTLSHTIGQMRQKFPALPRYPAIAASMKPGQLQALATAYLGSISGLSASAMRVSDKLLTNYYFAGLIHMLFPSAKIIHTKRNPIDTCWSAYTKLFKDDMPHSYDLTELGRYYKKYEEIMAHWHDVLPPGTLMDTNYEDMVNDLEGNARKIVDFCGLQWSDKCLDFHNSTRPVKTASVSQVRQPLYRKSMERWKAYETHLQPLIKALQSPL
jgi:tetratricopeptide (TPR) repeat protein